MWENIIWTVCFGIPFGVGLLAMGLTPPEFNVARGCLIVSALVLLARISWWITIEEHISNKTILISSIGGSFLLIGLLLGAGLYWINDREIRAQAESIKAKETKESGRVVVSPQQTVIEHNTNKNIILSVTNDNSHAIYDLCLSICVNDASIIPGMIKIKPLTIKEGINQAHEFSLAYYVMSNKCIAIIVSGTKGLSAHTTKEFFEVLIKGEKLTKDGKIAFNIYAWSNSPSLATTTPNQEGKMKVSYYFTPPLNPFFPNEKQAQIVQTKEFFPGVNKIDKREIEQIPNDGTFFIQ